MQQAMIIDPNCHQQRANHFSRKYSRISGIIFPRSYQLYIFCLELCAIFTANKSSLCTKTSVCFPSPASISVKIVKNTYSIKLILTGWVVLASAWINRALKGFAAVQIIYKENGL